MTPDKIRDLKRLYDGFEVKDLTWEQFLHEMTDVVDPKKMADDLSEIETLKATEKMNRMRIDQSLS